MNIKNRIAKLENLESVADFPDVIVLIPAGYVGDCKKDALGVDGGDGEVVLREEGESYDSMLDRFREVSPSSVAIVSLILPEPD